MTRAGVVPPHGGDSLGFPVKPSTKGVATPKKTSQPCRSLVILPDGTFVACISSWSPLKKGIHVPNKGREEGGKKAGSPTERP